MGNLVIWDYHVVLVLRAVTVQDDVPSSELLEHYPEAYCDSLKNNGETDTDNARGNESQGRSTGRLGHWQQTRSEAKRDHTQPGLPELDSERGSTDNDTLPIAWVYDLDSCANTPCSFSGEYITHSPWYHQFAIEYVFAMRRRDPSALIHNWLEERTRPPLLILMF